MISRLTLSALHMTARAFGIARFAGLMGLMGLVAACGGGGGSGGTGGGGGGGGGGNNPPTVTLSSISVAPASGNSTSVAAGLNLQLKATGTYSDSTTKDLTTSVTWTSSDDHMATVAAGAVTGVAAGAVTITATSDTVKGTYALTVAPPNLLSVEISPNAPTIPVTRIQQFTLFGKYTDGSFKPISDGVTWSSSNTSIATIDQTSGEATALNSLGNTNISATTASGPASSPVQLTVSATIYAYATNFDDNTVSQYQLNGDRSLGPLTGKETIDSNGTQPFSITMEPTGEYVYVANWASSTVAQYRIHSDGSLTSIGTGTVQVGLFPNSVTMSHNYKFAYVASLGNNTISQFQIGLDGQLIPLATPTITSGAAPAAVVVDPNDHFAYVGNYGANAEEPPAGPGTISQYAIALDGSLSPIGTGSVASGQGPNSLTINHAGTFLYAANHGDGNAVGTVEQFRIESDGSLTSLGPTNVGYRPVSIAIDLNDKFLYVANRGGSSTTGTVSQFTIDATTGALTPMAPATVAAGVATSAVAIDPTGQALYATDRGASAVYQFKIDSTTGALTPYATSTVPSGLHPTAIAVGY